MKIYENMGLFTKEMIELCEKEKLNWENWESGVEFDKIRGKGQTKYYMVTVDYIEHTVTVEKFIKTGATDYMKDGEIIYYMEV